MDTVLVITVAEQGPERFHTADAVDFLRSEAGSGTDLVWARGGEGELSAMDARLAAGAVHIEPFDFESNDASQRLMSFARALATRSRLTAIRAFGLGIASRLALVLGNVLGAPATVAFNTFQLRLAIERHGYVARWCARIARGLVATEASAYEEARVYFPAEVSISLQETISPAPSREIDLLAIVDSRYTSDVALAAQVLEKNPQTVLLDRAATFSPFDEELLAARTVIHRGSEADAASIRRFVRGKQWIHSSRWHGDGAASSPSVQAPSRPAPGLTGGRTEADNHTGRTQTPTGRVTRRRILFITYGYAPEPGGVPESSRRVVGLLRSDGHSVVVMAPENPDVKPEAGVLRLGSSLWQTDHELDVVVQQAVREHARDPFDIVFGFFVVPAGMFAVAVAKRLGIPSIVSARGNDVTKYGFISAPSVDWTLRNATAVAAVSRNLAEVAEAFDVASRPVTVVPNSTDLPASAPVVRPITRDVPVVGMAGIFRWKKGWEIFLRALALIGPRVQGRLIGDVVDAEKAKLDQLRLELSRDIECTGLIPEDEIPGQLRELDLFVSPSLDEGMPNTLLKAVSCGIPVVVSELPGHQVLIRDDAHGILVPLGDAEALAAAILRGLQEPARTRRATRALHTLATEFPPAAEYHAYVQLIESALRDSRGSARASTASPRIRTSLGDQPWPSTSISP